MKVLEPSEIKRRQDERYKRTKKRNRSQKRLWGATLALVIYCAAILLSPVPSISASVAPPVALQPQTAKIAWPAYGQIAIGAVGYGLLEHHGEETPLPTASVAKIVTALAVLKAHPIVAGAERNNITMTQADEDMYYQYASEGQSTAPVRAGQVLTEYQALEVMLLPSANNMAKTLAVWAYGSESDYITFANTFVKSLGMNNTVIADSSGFSPQTVSTAADLVKLAETAMNNTVIADIVSQSQADVPVTGLVYNTNYLLGKDGIIGMKTGNTDEAGGCYVFAAKRNIGGRDLTVVGAFMGAPNLYQAMKQTPELLDQVYGNFKTAKLLTGGQKVGRLDRKGQRGSDIIVKSDLSAVYWVANPPKYDVIIDDVSDKSVYEGEQIGNVIIRSGGQTYRIPAVALTAVPVQSMFKRLVSANGRVTL